MSILADSLNIEYKLIETSVFEKHFKPYIYTNIEEIADLGSTFQDKYKKNKLEYLIKKYQIEDNSWKFLLIEDKDKISYVYAFNPLKDIVERIDNKSEYREIKTTEFKITALDIYQICFYLYLVFYYVYYPFCIDYIYLKSHIPFYFYFTHYFPIF